MMQTLFLTITSSDESSTPTFTLVDASDKSSGYLANVSSSSITLNHSSKPVQDHLPNNVLTIGNFDGVHRGHQAMIEQLNRLKEQQNVATSVVMTFEPQPREYFANLKGDASSAPPRLTNLIEKQAKLSEYGVDVMLIANFDEAFRSLTAMQFADLLKQLSVKGLVLGDDFRFGHDRTGDGEFLAKQGLPVTNLDTVTDHTLNETDERISSTRIREALQAGKLAEANTLLGYDYAIQGEVVTGDQIGRTLDFPTANVTLNRIKPALHGVFTVDVVRLDDDGDVLTDGFHRNADNNNQGLAGLRSNSLFGVASIGTRPSIDGASEWRLEVHFPKFKGDLYGDTLDVRFLHFLHGEKKYPNLEALKAGIKNDVNEALIWLERAKSGDAV